MTGISYGGISQLFVGADRRPEPCRDRTAVRDRPLRDDPLSRWDPEHRLRPRWSAERVHDAKPASSTGGQPWALQEDPPGATKTCKANQALHGEAVNLFAKIRPTGHYIPAVADPLSPITFVNKIKVPTFMACQFTDEQTGGHCADLAEHFTATQHKWFTFTNGDHIDSLDPYTFNRWSISSSSTSPSRRRISRSAFRPPRR